MVHEEPRYSTIGGRSQLSNDLGATLLWGSMCAVCESGRLLVLLRLLLLGGRGLRGRLRLEESRINVLGRPSVEEEDSFGVCITEEHGTSYCHLRGQQFFLLCIKRKNSYPRGYELCYSFGRPTAYLSHVGWNYHLTYV